MSIVESFQTLTSEIDELSRWCEERYQTKFGKHFEEARRLFKRMDSTDDPITDAELEWVLTNLPIQLFEVSEDLNSVRLELEVIKLKVTERRLDIRGQYIELDDFKKLTETRKNEIIDTKMTDDIILMNAYSSIITRVENEITFCKELIMGCKKVWDGRRSTESVNPVAESGCKPVDLPDYQPRTYIK